MTTQPTPQPSAFRRHPWAFGIPIGVIAVILVSGLTAWGVTALVSAPLTPMGASSPMAMSSATAAPATGAPQKREGVRGTITAIAGSSWTIATKAGPTVTITVNSSTLYGTKAAPAAASDFAVGDSVAVIGTRTGDTGVATRVVKTTKGAGAGDTGADPTPSATPNS